MADRETRYTPGDLELRTVEGESLPMITGYAAVFNVLSDDLGGFKERIGPGAFARTLEERPDAIKAFHNHNSDIVIGSTRKGTLELTVDPHGLKVAIQPPDNEWGRPVVNAIERGDVEGMSFGFQLGHADAATWTELEDGTKVRDVNEAKLFEVSTVSGWPAYPQTSVGVRALAAALGADAEELEAQLAGSDAEMLAQLTELIASKFAVKQPDVAEFAQSNLDRARRVAERHGFEYESPATESPVATDAPTDGTALS